MLDYYFNFSTRATDVFRGFQVGPGGISFYDKALDRLPNVFIEALTGRINQTFSNGTSEQIQTIYANNKQHPMFNFHPVEAPPQSFVGTNSHEHYWSKGVLSPVNIMQILQRMVLLQNDIEFKKGIYTRIVEQASPELRETFSNEPDPYSAFKKLTLMERGVEYPAHENETYIDPSQIPAAVGQYAAFYNQNSREMKAARREYDANYQQHLMSQTWVGQLAFVQAHVSNHFETSIVATGVMLMSERLLDRAGLRQEEYKWMIHLLLVGVLAMKNSQSLMPLLTATLLLVLVSKRLGASNTSARLIGLAYAVNDDILDQGGSRPFVLLSLVASTLFGALPSILLNKATSREARSSVARLPSYS